MRSYAEAAGLPAGAFFTEGSGHKKYTAHLPAARNGLPTMVRVQFGDRRYRHYADRVPRNLGGGLWSHLDHRDENRRASYRRRHGAIRRGEEAAHEVPHTPAWFSWHFLW